MKLSWKKWGFAVLRTAAVPAVVNVTIDVLTTTAPFTSLKGLTLLAKALGVADVSKHVDRVLASHRASGVIPLVVFVPMALIGLPHEDDAVGGGLGAEMQGPPEGFASQPRQMLFIPDVVAGGGWLVTQERWSG